MCSGARAGPFFTRSWPLVAQSLESAGAWGQAANNAGSGVARQLQVSAGRKEFTRGQSHPGASSSTHRTPPGGGAGRLLWGLEEFLHVPRPRAGRHTASWKLERGQGWSTHPWALPARPPALLLPLRACFSNPALPPPGCPAFKLLPRGPRMPQASVFPMLSLSGLCTFHLWASSTRPQQEGCSCRRARPCCLP